MFLRVLPNGIGFINFLNGRFLRMPLVASFQTYNDIYENSMPKTTLPQQPHRALRLPDNSPTHAGPRTDRTGPRQRRPHRQTAESPFHQDPPAVRPAAPSAEERREEAEDSLRGPERQGHLRLVLPPLPAPRGLQRQLRRVLRPLSRRQA